MGACCNKQKSETPQPETPKSAPIPQPTQTFRLAVSCTEIDLQLVLNLSPDLPLSALKEMIQKKLPEISFKEFCIKIEHKELIDDTATLKQMLIQNGDHIRLERIVESSSDSVDRQVKRSRSSRHKSSDNSSVSPIKPSRALQSGSKEEENDEYS